jgi:hypothetical protein
MVKMALVSIHTPMTVRLTVAVVPSVNALDDLQGTFKVCETQIFSRPRSKVRKKYGKNEYI